MAPKAAKKGEAPPPEASKEPEVPEEEEEGPDKASPAQLSMNGPLPPPLPLWGLGGNWI